MKVLSAEAKTDDGDRPRSSLALDVHGSSSKTSKTGKGQSGKKVNSATVEDPESDLPGSTRLVKGKSMPSLR